MTAMSTRNTMEMAAVSVCIVLTSLAAIFNWTCPRIYTSQHDNNHRLEVIAEILYELAHRGVVLSDIDSVATLAELAKSHNVDADLQFVKQDAWGTSWMFQVSESPQCALTVLSFGRNGRFDGFRNDDVGLRVQQNIDGVQIYLFSLNTEPAGSLIRSPFDQ